MEAVVLTLQDVADKLGVCKRTIWRWVHQRKLETVMVGSVRKIKVQELDRYLEDNTVPRKRE